MKIRKITALLLAVLMAAVIAGCAQKAPAPVSSPSDTAVSVTDMTGRGVTLDKPAEKIVVITASDAEILYALGAGATVVGRGEYCDYPAEISNITSVKSGADTNIEQIVALKPDVVLMSQMDQTKEQVASLENAGLKVVMSNAQDINGVYTAITMIGQVVGKNDEAKTVIDSMKKTFDDIKTKVQSNAALSAKTIYFEVYPLSQGLYAAGTGTFMDEIGTMLGLKNIFSDKSDWPPVSEEQVIQRNPDFIVTTSMSVPGAPDPVSEIKSRKGWENITAIKNGAVFNADSSALTRPGPRLAGAAQDLYNFIYGDTAPTPSPSN
ncbi:ABC transporter substrate-binding protein [Sporobacter termitidis]|nr:ABC transporter substrate-binding protein [Sporobacter termitidis]